jgi:hypothetical protein
MVGTQNPLTYFSPKQNGSFMTTLPPPATKFFPEDSIEKQCYNIAESMRHYIPGANERNRLGFNLYRFVKGEGDKPEIIVRNAKLKVEGISLDELAQKLNEALAGMK